MSYAAKYSESQPSRAEVDALEGVTVLEFGADWCGHCIAAQRAIEPVLHARDSIVHIKVADGKGKPLGRSFHIKLWPTLVVLRDGVETGRVVRPRDVQEIERVLAQ